MSKINVRHLLIFLFSTFGLISTVAAKDPRFFFMMECQGCHLADGSGGVASIPPLNNHVAKFLTVPGGREFLAQVPGVARSPLKDEEITAVLNWVLNEFGPRDIAKSYPPYTVDEVSQLRKNPLTEVSKRRAYLLKEMSGNTASKQQTQ